MPHDYFAMNKQRTLIGAGTAAVALVSIGAAAWYVCRRSRKAEGDESLNAFAFEPSGKAERVSKDKSFALSSVRTAAGVDTVNGETIIQSGHGETRDSNFVSGDDNSGVQPSLAPAVKSALIAASHYVADASSALNNIDAASSTVGTDEPASITALLDETLNEIDGVDARTAAATMTVTSTSGASAPGTEDVTLVKSPDVEQSVATPRPLGATFIDRLGVWINLPDGWEANREFTPSPNIFIVSISNPALGNANEAETPGQIPILALTAEDVRRENLNLVEFNERSKEVSLQQMLMLTGGAIRPSIRRDSTIKVGPFRRLLEYAQYVPSFFDLTVINLSEIRNGIVYSLQITCNSATLEQYKPLFMQLAQDVHIEPIPLTQTAYLDVDVGGLNMHIDPTWSLFSKSAKSADDADRSICSGTPLAMFHHLSSVKPEELEVYTRSSAPVLSEKARSTKTVDDVTITSYFNGAREVKSVSYGDFVMLVRPVQKAISFIPEECLIAAIRSASLSVEAVAPEALVRFVDTENNYCFDMKPGSQVISSVLNKGTVIYILQGNPQDIVMQQTPEERGPLVTIRFGTPEEEPDCMGSLEEWRARIDGDETLGTVSNLCEITLKNMRCLHFTSKAMQEVGINARAEMKEGVYIFVRDGISTVLRWETVTSQWRKYESDLKNFIESFTFMN